MANEQTRSTSESTVSEGDTSQVYAQHADIPDHIAGPFPRWAFESLWQAKGWLEVEPPSTVVEVSDANASAPTISKVEPATGAKGDTPTPTPNVASATD